MGKERRRAWLWCSMLLVAQVGCTRGGFGYSSPIEGGGQAGDGSAGDGSAGDGSTIADGAGVDGAAGGGAFILFGEDARRLVSFDRGTSWVVDQADATHGTGTNRRLMSAASGAGVALLVGGPWAAAGGFVLRSTDGHTWQEIALSGGQGPLTVAFGNGTFVATNNIGERYTSPDGTNWQATGWSPASGRQICFANGKFFVAGDQGVIGSSTDGVKWETNELGGGGFSAAMCGNGRFVAIGPGRRVTTIDGVTPIKAEAAPGLCDCGMLAYGNGVFVDYQCNTSADGISWTPAASDCQMNAIAFGDGVFIGVSTNKRAIYRSTDGQTWERLRGQPMAPDAYLVGFVRLAGL